MKKSSKGLFILAFILALIGAGAFYVYLSGLETPQIVETKTVSIVVAAVEIPARTLITDEMIKTVEVPENSVLVGGLSSVEEVVGKYTRALIFAQQPIHPGALIEDVSDELSMKVKGNHRAMTLSVSGATGVSNLIEPGDRVDVVVYLPQIVEQNRIVRPDIAKLLLQNIEVLAVDRSLNRDASKNQSTAEEVDPIGAYFVTLSVPVTEVESLVLAKDIGTIDLALRPFEDDYSYVTSGVIWQELLLNDAGKLKDFFPDYEFEGVDYSLLEPGTYVYSQYVYYTIEFGDTLRSISEKFYGTSEYVDLLKQVNKIEDENLILAGTGIKIPVLEEGEADNGN